jgi:hypothetical protein
MVSIRAGCSGSTEGSAEISFPVHVLTAWVGLKSVEHQLTGLGQLAEAELEVLELARTDAAASGGPANTKICGPVSTVDAAA